MSADASVEMQARKRTLLDALFRKYQRALARYLSRQHFNREEVADIVQDTYVRMHHLPDVESIQFPKAFLFRVAGNLARNNRKHERVVVQHGTVDADSIDIAADAPSAYRVLKAEQELAIVRAAFLELTPKCRQVFVMNRFDQCSYAQIATELGISVSMVEKYISQALAHLRLRVAGTNPASRSLRLLK